MLTFEQKVQAHLAQARAQQIAHGTAAPLLWRLFWKLGWQLPPPLFLGLGRLALIHGSFFGSVWGLVMYAIDWRDRGMSVVQAFGFATLAGALFGLLMAMLIARQKRRLSLPPWKQFSGH